MGQGDFDDFGAEFTICRNGLFNGSADVCIETVDEIFFRQADPDSAQVAVENGLVIGDRSVHRGRIRRIVTGDRLQQQGAVPHIAGDWADLVER